jgi:hypothetical protein
MKYRVFFVMRVALWEDYTDPTGKKFRTERREMPESGQLSGFSSDPLSFGARVFTRGP